jgi:hypothetical protein
MLREKPPPGQEDGFSEMSSAGCFDNSEIKPPRQNTQIKFQDPAALEVNARFKKFPQDWLAAYDLSDPEDLAQLQQASDTVAANPDMKYEFVNELTIRNVRLKPVKVVESKIGEFTAEQCYDLLEDIFDFAYGLGRGEASVMVAETRRSFENEGQGLDEIREFTRDEFEEWRKDLERGITDERAHRMVLMLGDHRGPLAPLDDDAALGRKS